MAEIIISCAADLDLAKALNDYLLSSLYPIENSSIILENDEIYINDKDAFLSRKKIIEAIRLFIERKKHYENYQITEYDNIITVGVTSKPEQLMENM